MGTQLKQWAIRLLAIAALPIMLTLSFGVAANARTVPTAQVTNSVQNPSAHQGWEVYGPYYFRDNCLNAEDEFGGPRSHCGIQYRDDYGYEYWVWYLYVPYCDCVH